MNHKEAAVIIENQILDSFKIKIKNFQIHPTRLIQASKSLIGLNLEIPNQKLLKFNLSIFDNKNYATFKSKKNIQKSLNEVINIHDLERVLRDGDKNEIFDIAMQLSAVSSELHILEYFIEVSLKQSGKSFLLIWSLYKSILFINKKNIDIFLEIVIEAILLDDFEDINFTPNNFNIDIVLTKNLSLEFFDLYSHLIEAYNSDLVRSLKIKPLIIQFLSSKLNKMSLDEIVYKNKELKYNNLLLTGRIWLLDFLNKFNLNDIDINFILFLDSVRCLLRFSEKKNKKLVCFQFERLLKNFDVK